MVSVYDFAIFDVRRDAVGGLLLTRTSDGADVYFQPGDDANRFEDECEALVRLEETQPDKCELIALSTLGAYF